MCRPVRIFISFCVYVGSQMALESKSDCSSEQSDCLILVSYLRLYHKCHEYWGLKLLIYSD